MTAPPQISAAPPTPAVLRGRPGAVALAEYAVLALLPLLYLAWLSHASFGDRGFFDLHIFWNAGRDVLAGRSPYPSTPQIAARTETNFVYPAPMALLFAPLGLLPFAAAALCFSVVLVASVFLTLKVLGVRDWRCYGVAFLWLTTMTAISTGTVSPLIALGVAALWRFRDRRLAASVVLAAIVVAKLFVWPLFVWLLATRRWRSAIVAGAVAVATMLIAWAALGFSGLRAYPHLLDALTAAEGGRSYSFFALCERWRLGGLDARLVLGAAALAACAAVIGRRRDERASFVVAVGATLLLSPIVWAHYLILLLVPIGLARPQLSRLWFVPLAFWVLLYTAHNDGSIVRLGIALATCAGIVGVAARSYPRSSRPFANSPAGALK